MRVLEGRRDRILTVRVWHCMVLSVLTCVLGTGCAQFKFSGFRTVPEAPQRMEVVGESLGEYAPVTVVDYPRASYPVLHLRLLRDMIRTVRYDSVIRTDSVFEKKRKSIEGAYAGIGLGAVIAFADGPSDVSVLLGAIIGGVSIWAAHEFVDPRKLTEARYASARRHRVPFYRRENGRVAAVGETLITDTGQHIVTDADGVATLRTALVRYDNGVTLRHVNSGRTYLVRRILREAEVTAEWADRTARALKLGGRAMTFVDLIRRIRRLRGAAGLATAPTVGGIVIIIVIDLVSGAVIDEVVSTLATTTVPYYDWIFLEVR